MSIAATALPARTAQRSRPGLLLDGAIEKEKSETVRARLPWPVALFVVGLMIPWIIPLGPLSMPAFRLALLATIAPCTIGWLRGKAGRFRIADGCVLLFCIWATMSLVIAHGGRGIQTGGALFIDTMGAYLLARCHIRDAASFRGTILFIAGLVVLLMPFLLDEWLTGQKPLLNIFGAVFPTVDTTLMTPRMGFWRVQGPFAHSILYGALVGSLVSLTWLVAGQGMGQGRRLTMTCVIGFAAALSMSSAPLAGVLLQIALIGWDTILKRYSFRWKILWGMIAATYLVIALGSNQTPVQFYISKFTFDQSTGWYRIWIWNYGSASVLAHPIFGIGLADWARPKWMAADTVDNFWLLTAMRYGLPAILLLAGAVLTTSTAVARRKDLPLALAPYRTAFLICITAFCFVGSTVHFWDAPYAWFLFLLGSGAFLLDAKPERETSEPAAVVSASPGRSRHIRPLRNPRQPLPLRRLPLERRVRR